MQEQTIVSIVEDDKPTRDVICEMVSAMGLEVKAYVSAEDFLQKYTKSQLECMILDVRMSGISGMELLAKLADEDMYIPTIIVTGHGDIPMAVEAVNMGAIDFLEKPFREQALWNSIQKALETCKTVRFSRQSKKELKEKLLHLTQSDIDSLKLLIKGYSDKQVASKLDVSRRAVAFHRLHILEKTGVKSIMNLATSMTKHDISL
ncbi:response regulator transcription factor [Candidatus Pacearchaeota archaeon]|nr:response regulator transcription factor [Candidatus Pacearchaeota archaeon]